MNLHRFSACQDVRQSAYLRVPADDRSYEDPATKRPLMHFVVRPNGSLEICTYAVMRLESFTSADRGQFIRCRAAPGFVF